METKIASHTLSSIILIVSVFAACGMRSKHTFPIPLQTRGTDLDTISKLSDMRGDSAIFVHNGNYSFVVKSKYVETAESEDVVKDRSLEPNFETYRGIDRADAKLSIPETEKIVFLTTTELRASLIPDSIMRSKKVGLKTNSARTLSETQNVSVTKAYLFAISREADNDLHLIIGNKNANGAPIKLLNCEITGLPDTSAPSYATLKSVRDYIIGFLGTDFTVKPGPGYIVFTSGLKMTIEGPLFYDIGHGPGIIGPKSFRSPTAWEIHPVSYIAFD